jgi:pyruvyltransferase
MKIYYWKGKKNFGDLLTPLLINKFTHLDTEWAEPKNAQLVSVGSIIDLLPMNWPGVIAGAGILHEHLYYKTTYPILAVRGPLTLQRIMYSVAHDKQVVLADPGLIADELVGPQEKLYNLGIVPHWTDKELELNPDFLKYNPKIIRVGDDPLEVIKQIGQCRKIVSSSLHGIVLADAFGIPRRIEIPPLALSRPKQEGGLFKWLDYSASIEMKLEIGVTQLANANIIIEKQHELFDVFQEIKSIFS